MKGILTASIVLTLLLLTSCTGQQPDTSENSSASSQSVSGTSSQADAAPQVADGYAGTHLYTGANAQECGFRAKIPKIVSEKQGANALNQQIAATYNSYRTAIENKTTNGDSMWEVWYDYSTQEGYISIIIHETHNNYPGEPSLSVQVVHYDYLADKTLTTGELLVRKGQTLSWVIDQLKTKAEAAQNKERLTEEDWKDWIPPVNEMWLSEVQADVNKLSLWYQGGVLWVCYRGDTMMADAVTAVTDLS